MQAYKFQFSQHFRSVEFFIHAPCQCFNCNLRITIFVGILAEEIGRQLIMLFQNLGDNGEK